MAGAAPPTPEGLARAALLDPFGLSAFFEQTRYWTPAERDARPVALVGRLLLNRLLWLGVAGAVLAVVYWRFTFRVGGAPAGRRGAGGRVRRPDHHGEQRDREGECETGRDAHTGVAGGHPAAARSGPHRWVPFSVPRDARQVASRSTVSACSRSSG
jgi:hypothetical protein